ncbi:hypothetical protein ND748_08605 [Frankia sp. AiPs1]|uniref:hypothetical protein n=1 Tax=Frankia sp. AiPs1 TaxID=573493 RepID=UPI0020444CC0|nr:hypothetical protein [Frankia sp. AiPs1]MCM3921723.1 hypothetical protein [Frankia sp. AiPs1]
MISDGDLPNRVELNFLYNPSIVTASHSVDLNADGVLPSYARNKDDIGSYITPLNATVSFDLLFDRTYELWDSAKSKQEEYQTGVLADIGTFYKMVGMYDQYATTVQGSGKTGDAVMKSSGSLGPMIPTNAVVLFGAWSNSLSYYGMIQSGNVQFTHWTGAMIPQRATLSIGMQLITRDQDPKNLIPFGQTVNSYTPPRVR